MTAFLYAFDCNFLAQFDDQTLGGFAPDPGNGRKRRNRTLNDRPLEIANAEAGDRKSVV